MLVGVQTASFYFMAQDYERELDQRIALAIACDAEHLELSNGPSIMQWRPDPCKITVPIGVHAEVYRNLGITPEAILAHLHAWDMAVQYIVWHPNELIESDYELLLKSEIPCLIENMDTNKNVGRTVEEVRALIRQDKFGITLDIQHCETNGINVLDFADFNIVNCHISRLVASAHALLADAPSLLPMADYYTIEGIIYTVDSFKHELARIKAARDAYILLAERHVDKSNWLVSGKDGIIISGRPR